MSYYDDDDEFHSSFYQKNTTKIVLIVFLSVAAVASSGALAFVYYKQVQFEKELLRKKNSWSGRLEEFAPILKIAGSLIKIIIKVAFSLLLI